MKQYLIDSSVVLEILLSNNKQLVKRLSFLIDNSDISSSDFIKMEVSNVISKRIKNLNEMEEMFSNFLKLDIQYLKINDSILFAARRLSKKFDVSVYEASYHALALSNGIIFLTLDKKYFEKAGVLGNIELFT